MMQHVLSRPVEVKVRLQPMVGQGVDSPLLFALLLRLYTFSYDLARTGPYKYRKAPYTGKHF